MARDLTSESDEGYSQSRLAHYHSSDWGSLPLAASKVRPVLALDLGQPIARPDESWRTVSTRALASSPRALEAQGTEAFSAFPAQVEGALSRPVPKDKNGPSRYGLWQSSDSVGGLVWVALPGEVYPTLPCSSCHASVDRKGRLRHGVPNPFIDIGPVKDDDAGMRSLDSTWGPGREDVAADGKENPVVIADVRAVRFQTHLHWTANVENSQPSLALRIETGLIPAHYGSARPTPPRCLRAGLLPVAARGPAPNWRNRPTTRVADAAALKFAKQTRKAPPRIRDRVGMPQWSGSRLAHQCLSVAIECRNRTRWALSQFVGLTK